MVIKMISKDGSVHYQSVEEVSVKKIWVKGTYDGYKNPYKESDIMYQNDIHNMMVKKIQKETGWDNQCIDFLTDTDFKDMDYLIIICPYNKGKVENLMAIDNKQVYLMSDKGETIERLM